MLSPIYLTNMCWTPIVAGHSIALWEDSGEEEELGPCLPGVGSFVEISTFNQA